jgi:hypothetical protein
MVTEVVVVVEGRTVTVVASHPVKVITKATANNKTAVNLFIISIFLNIFIDYNIVGDKWQFPLAICS